MPVESSRAARASRAIPLAAALLTTGAGLAVHRGLAPSAFRDIAGDALWAAMMFWWVSAAWPRGSVLARGGLAVAIAWAVEFSQLSHASWLVAARATRFGPLVLGTGFDPRDLASYVGGVALAMLAAHLLRSR